MDDGLTSEIDHILSTARSVRRKLDFETAVSKQDIEACIDVAVQAPTGLAGENWRFMVITDAELKSKIADIYRDVLLQISQPGIEAPGQLAFYGSILPAAWSLMLAMRARGIGTTWTSLLSSRSDEISELLGIPKGVTQTGMLPAAYTKGANLKKAKRQPAREVTYWNGWLQKD